MGYRPPLFSGGKRGREAIKRARRDNAPAQRQSPSMPGARSRSYNPAPRGADPVRRPVRTTPKQGRRIEKRVARQNRRGTVRDAKKYDLRVKEQRRKRESNQAKRANRRVVAQRRQGLTSPMVARRKFVKDFGRLDRGSRPLSKLGAQRDRATTRAVRQTLRLPGAVRPPTAPKLKSYTRGQYRALKAEQGRYVGKAYREAVRGGAPKGERAFRTVEREAESRSGVDRGRDAARGRRVSRAQGRAASAYGMSKADYLAWRRTKTLRPGKAGGARNAAGNPQVAGLSEESVGRFLSNKTIPGVLARPPKDAGGFAERGMRDLISLPANVVSGGYLTGKAAVKAARGDTGDAKELLRQFKDTDPVALAAQGRFKEAGRSVSEHPGAAALEVAGGLGAVSRLGGAASRVSRTGSTAAIRRPPRRVPNTNLVEHRTYARGAVGEAAQRAGERHRTGKVQTLRGKARDLEARGEYAKAQAKRDKASLLKQKDTQAPATYIAKRVDAREGLAQSQRRPHRAEAAKAARTALREPVGRTGKRTRKVKHPEVVSLVAQGIVKADRQDLKQFSQELDAAFNSGRLRRSQRGENRATKRAVDKAVADPDLDTAAAAAAAKRYSDVQKPLERELVAEKMLDPHEAEKAKVIDYAARKMGARVDPEQGLVREARIPGRREPMVQRLSVDAVKTHMRDNDVNPDDVAFVSHTPRANGSGAFNVSGRKPQGIGGKARTGRAGAEGLTDLDPERMVEQNVRMRGLVDATRQFKGFVSEMALRHPGGKLVHHDTKGEADRVVRNLNRDRAGNEVAGATEWTAVKAQPFASRAEQFKKLVDDADDEGFTSDGKHPVSEALQDALRGKGGDEGGWIVVPKVAAQRLDEHAGVVRSSSPALRAVTQAFRKTVLPLSPSWVTGNVVEGALRTGVNRAGVRSWAAERRVYQEMARRGPLKAEELRHRTPSGHFGGAHETMIHVSARQFENGKLAPVAKAFDALRRTPGPKHIANAYRAYTDWMMGTLNGGMEAQFARAMAGRHMRKELMTPAGRKAGETAIEQAARGLRDTNEQARMADTVRRAYGQYDSFSPAMRKWVLNYSPFAAWTINALRFLGSVLPKDHPALTAALAANHQLSEDWRKQHGLDIWAANPLPGFLQGSIPMSGGGHLRVARYTPFGVAATPLDTIASNVLPQFSGPLMTFRGLDWKGDKLRDEHGKPVQDPLKLGQIAAREFAYATVPITGQVARGSQKEGSTAQKAKQVLNPFNPVQPRKDKAGGSSAKSPVDQKLDAIDKKLSGGTDDALEKKLDAIDKKIALP